MRTTPLPNALTASLADDPRTQSLVARDLYAIHRRTDHMFIALLIFEWIAGIVVALIISPRAWEGSVSHTHIHVYSALYLGGLIVAFPILAALLRPGTVFSRQSIAAAQVLYSALLIHLTGGRIETHFHVFGSLAFLAMYRDWRVLVTASIIVAIDHFLRGIYWPASVYNVLSPSPFRWLEHVTWVLFEDIVLMYAIRQSLREMHAIATRQTALEIAMQRAEAADAAKGAFLAQMSHEIRTPMTAILGFADMMALEGRPCEEAVGAIRQNGKHLLTLLDDVLDLSKIESGQLRVEKSPADITQLLHDVQHLMAPRATQRNIALILQCPNLQPALNTDIVRLRQIVLNLLSNALKFTLQGEVRVSADFTPDHTPNTGAGTLTLRVADTGIGLSPEQQSRLFKPFAQADDSHHRRYGGTGLGLVICQRLATLLNGSISVHSELGAGSTFTVQIPVEVAATHMHEPAAPRQPVNRSTIPPRLVGKRILVVDDAADNRRLLSRLLTLAGCTVETANDGSAAIESALVLRPDLILMDMLMPHVDGYQATRQLRDRGYAGPIIALTAHASTADEAKCRQSGCNGYIAKPFDCDHLLAGIQITLNSRHPTPATV